MSSILTYENCLHSIHFGINSATEFGKEVSELIASELSKTNELETAKLF